MKNLKVILVSMVLLGSILSVSAQRSVVNVYPKYGTVVTAIHKPRVIIHKNTQFYFANGIWYRARGRKYVGCAAPVGIQVRHLPRGNKVVHVNGRRLYRYKGVWYKKKGTGFVVVTV